MTQPKPLADDVPLDRAWKIGRRIYVRTGYQSALNGQLRDLGAKWDPEAKALWVGSGKTAQVLELVQAQETRVAATVAVKAAGRWVSIPFDATGIRAQAKSLGARWDGDRKQWAMPTDEALTEILNALTAWERAREAKKTAPRVTAQEADRLSVADRAENIIAASGRTATGERGSAHGRLQGRMRRPEAERVGPKPGDIRRLKNGSRVLVLTGRVEFVTQDAIDDGFVGNLWDEPGWRYEYTYAVLTPTAEEAEADRRERAEREDEQTIAALMDDVQRAAASGEVVPGMPRIPAGRTLTRTSGSVQPFNDGTVTLTDDGEVWWHHPGYYDDYRAIQGQVTDEAVIERVRAVFADGARRRGPYRVNA